jgi:hypothetical protein
MLRKTPGNVGLWLLIGSFAGAAGAQQCTVGPASFSTNSGGRIDWSPNADKSVSGSTEERAKGSRTYTCRYSVPAGAQKLTITLGETLVYFTGRTANMEGSGLVVSVSDARAKGKPANESACTIPLVQVAGEDLIRAGGVVYQLALSQPTSAVAVSFQMIDTSERGTVRIDLRPPQIAVATAENGLLECPGAPPRI